MIKSNTTTQETDALFEELKKDIRPTFNIAQSELEKLYRPIFLEDIIGFGGFALVAEAYAKNLVVDEKERHNLHCAVKIIYPQRIHGPDEEANYVNRKRFNKEYASIRQVYTNLKGEKGNLEKHIVRAYDEGEFDYDKYDSLGIKKNWFVKNFSKLFKLNPEISWKYMVSEYVKGKDLSHYKGKIGIKDIIQIGKIVCKVLEVTHEQDILHRDLKPSNILLPYGKINNLKVTDFGLAKRMDAGAQDSNLIFGSMGFAAPEQIDYKSRFKVDGRADIFGLGAVLYNLASGQLPYGERDVKLLHGKDHIPIPNPALLTDFIDEPEFSEVLEKALFPYKAKRYSNAGEFREDLEWVDKKL